MPMLIVDDKSFEKELSKLQSNKQQNELTGSNKNELIGNVVEIHKGRPFGRIEVPESIRKLVAEEAILGTPAKQVMKSFGVSQSSVSAYKVGATSTASYNEPNKELKQANDDLVTEVSSSARSKLTLALQHITAEKISEAKVGTISQIAKDMSAIVKNLEPTNPAVVNQNQIIVYRPKQRDEDDFEIITVNE